GRGCASCHRHEHDRAREHGCDHVRRGHGYGGSRRRGRDHAGRSDRADDRGHGHDGGCAGCHQRERGHAHGDVRDRVNARPSSS
ncbi:hypothetical protein ABTP13_18940, partial [Acinetobacter baumannii]